MRDRLDSDRFVLNWLRAELDAGHPLDTFRPTPDAAVVDVPALDTAATNAGDAFPVLAVNHVSGVADDAQDETGEDFPSLSV